MTIEVLGSADKSLQRRRLSYAYRIDCCFGTDHNCAVLRTMESQSVVEEKCVDETEDNSFASAWVARIHIEVNVRLVEWPSSCSFV